MTPYDDLLRDLAGHWLGTKQDEKLLQSLRASLTRFRATSTDEFSIDRRWESLCEKISIKGQGDLANDLRVLKTKLFDHNNDSFSSSSLDNITTTMATVTNTTPAQESIVKYDILSLILALSQGTQPNHIPTSLRRSIQVDEKDLWNDIMNEEPLDGDHWKQWSEDDDDGEDDRMSTDSDSQFVLDQEHYVQRYQQQNRQQEQGDLNELARKEEREAMINERMDDMRQEVDHYDLELLHERQYWDDSYHLNMEGNDGRYISEANVNSNSLTLKHLSQNAYIGILNEFCNYGNMIYNLREWSNKIIHHKLTQQFGQTCTAFAICVATLLQDFEMLISDLEVNNCKDGQFFLSLLDEQQQPVISLLQLKVTLNDSIQAFKAIYDIIVDSLVKDLNQVVSPSSSITPRQVTTGLLNGLYNGILRAQLIGKDDTYNTLIHVFYETIQPYGRLLNDWVSHASLQGDNCREFFIDRSIGLGVEIGNNDQLDDFWSKGYKVADNDHHEKVGHDSFLSPCPLFDQAFMERVIYIGKAVWIISKFGIKTNEEHKSFNNCLQTVITKPKPVIEKKTTMTITTSPSPLSSDKVQTANDTFLRAGFPLQFAHRHQSEQKESIVNQGIDEVPFLFDQSMIRCLDKYITEPYQQATYHLNRTLKNHGLLENCLLSISSIYLMLDNNLMHVFCEALFTEMDINNGVVTEDAIQKLFMDAKLTIEWDLPGTSECYLISKSLQPLEFLNQIRFAYHIPWPINNFIKETTLKYYGVITTLLLQLKRAKYLLDRKMLFQNDRRNMRLYPMRMKLIWFINAFWSYIMTTILYTETIRFRKSIEKAMDADEIIQLHNEYISKIVDRCLLGDKTQSIHKAVLKILDMVSELTMLFTNEGDDEMENDVDFVTSLDNMEKDFNRSNEFIATTLKIVGRKGGFSWCKILTDD
ncbi:hypothetical protein INT45_002836 [Circinella minor]|uniref:Spindle pole body component n=1 Tax=Circinella minor TaxID=1195481 RepID=A0A8H7VLZ4_9FUNG|nr:hypothetical protein INT45_002836 [Circinella minor]